MRSIRSLVAASWCVLALLATRANADPVGTAFTYQGELLQGGSPVTTPVTLVFRLFDAPAGGAQIGAAVSVPGVTPAANGRFKVDLDFGAVALGDAARWLEIQVGATTLSRQRLAVAPYAFRAQVAASASTAALAATSTDAAALAGQPASFYQNAANLISGTLPDSRLSANVPRLGLSNAFSGALNTFAGNVSIGTAMSGERLSVAGVVHATAGGFRFPNGSLQLVASPPTTVFVVGPEATDPYSTIQAAVAAAQASGLPATVAVKPGTYAGSVTITTPGTWVVAVGGAHSARLNGCVTVALSAAGRAGWSGVDIRCTGADAFLVSGSAHALVRLDDAVVTATTGHAVTMACSGTAGTARSRLECSGVDARSLTSLEAVLLMAANAEVVYARGILAKQDPDPEPKPRPDNGKGLEAPVGDCRLEDVEVDCEVDASGSAKVRLTRCDVATVDTRAVRARQSAELEARQCVISSGTAECARCDDSATVTVASCTLRTSRAEACVVAGAASVRYAAVAFDGGARRMALAAQPLNADELLRVTRYVVGPGGAGLWSLQDAINSACAVSTLSGEPQTVYVMPGVYAGPINVPGGRVTLAAAV
ncbi:MAG: hypothetical protein JNJ48_05985, partial [Phycisphaerae bacterium]|nr:hypothetical protein [Phycisphaerae bacterium]